MFGKHREAWQAKRRHAQLMHIATDVVWRKDVGLSTRWDREELARLFAGRVYSSRGESIEPTDAFPYIAAALADRGISLPCGPAEPVSG
ncbi:hypothetical protein [Streptomyces fuscigenes]|uniref:hypothetical protein n=1 Tax=Streptomyces fuscigenes TaxID=1528880 RepID=UPI001F288A5C|nr:hypothetical protein [Streptomyces fuscigenes]MCF3960477.1 hypothetical protein [Streptomyces fuscigenes]